MTWKFLAVLVPCAADIVSAADAPARVTLNGCACKKVWEEVSLGSCSNYCCNPDNDTAGAWCQVVDLGCEDSQWGTCADGQVVNNITPGCVDVPGWRDTDGDGCSTYAARSWCTSDGKQGMGWHTEWGSVDSFTANGYTPVTACCACGGGSGSQRASTGDRFTYSGCKCKKNWEQSWLLGYNVKCDNSCCNPENSHAGDWCMVEDTVCEDSEWGYCRADSVSSTVTNYTAQHGHCTDMADWRDVDNDGCADYAMSAYCTDVGGFGLGWNVDWGSFSTFARGNSFGADVACCACGGGTRDDFFEYYLQYFYYYGANPYKERSTWTGCACKESWEHKGEKCDSYCCDIDSTELGDWCKVVDSTCEGADWGYCQTDGLGTYVRPLQDAAHCTDATTDAAGQVAWHDKDGDDCATYGMNQFCTANGGVGLGWHDDWGDFSAFEYEGKTAVTACCVCGGGIRQGSESSLSSLSDLKAMFLGDTHMFKVASGPCRLEEDGCITSGNYPQPYGPSEQCQIAVNPSHSTPIHVVDFDTEVGFDLLRVNGNEFTGTRGPAGLLPSGTIHWGADGQDQKKGWKLCPRSAEKQRTSEQVVAIGGLWVFMMVLCCCCCCLIVAYCVRREQRKPHGDGLGAGPTKPRGRYAQQDDDV